MNCNLLLQVVILIFLPKMRDLRSLKIMKFLNSLILLQFLSRFYPIFKMCMRVNKDMVGLFKKKTKDMLDDKKLPIRIPKWFGIAVNIHGYILASHVCFYLIVIYFNCSIKFTLIYIYMLQDDDKNYHINYRCMHI